MYLIVHNVSFSQIYFGVADDDNDEIHAKICFDLP